ncbi:hypothetical protein MIND_00061800 [Mycena indigotica]|uniref:Ribonuclease H2 subunit B n=1 Tax=Mycena indigotica TaxID=2126181 RepID=A0A8H6WHV1_9AGAR|nr:uncharacterized protein MIND_00061800 [Mycena indigotica]KAF7315468.1 hypothetical protein MIND_00061800 [Mycena indigotica]
MATHLAVLPDALPLEETRFLRLLHPRTELPTLFLAHPDSILEVQSVSPTNERSWFIDQTIVSDGKLLLFTPVDLAFLLIPVLQSVYSENFPGMFRPADEIFEDAATILEQPADTSNSISREDMTYFTSIKGCTRALRCVCDVQEISEDIVVYRYSREKVVQYVRNKVERLSRPEITEISRTLIRNLAKDGLLEDGREELLKLGRIRAACDLVCQYLPSNLRTLLLASYDFSALEAHVRSLEEERASLVVQKPSKSKAAPTPVEKKRKDTSQGVEKLKKAKTTGMAKLSTFFSKKETKRVQRMEAASLAINPSYVDRAVQTDLHLDSLVKSAPATPPKDDSNSVVQHRVSGPTRSPNSRKHHQLPYSRPSTQNHNSSPRVSSLPETLPSYPTVIPREFRGASLSERPRVSLSFSDNTPESSSSAETSFRSETRSGSSRARRSLPSSDTPHTPSPPSSPGWISWASSPPKPIPALHGPLSLPYARCPSGAEGTIVEGEDLSRMIWGLGLEDSQPTNTPNIPQKSTSFAPRSRPQRDAQYQRSISFARQSHERDVSRESVESRVGAFSQHPDSWRDSLGLGDDILDEFEDDFRVYDGQRGLGLDWQETLKHRQSTAKAKIDSLKPSAAVFVPASQQVTSQFPRIFVEPRHTVLPSPRLSAFEIAQQYRANKRPQDFLPTPPSSSSPEWISQQQQQHYIDPFPPLDLHTLVSPPQSQSNFELSQELRKFVFERMQNPNDTRSVELPREQFNPSRIPQTRRPSIDASPSLPGPPPNSPLPPIPSYANHSRVHFGITPASPTSPDTLAPLRQSSKHPRSIPFARLLQRRLSAVPEEETTPYEMHSPPPSPPTKHSTAIPMRAPRVPSSSQTEGFRSRTRSSSGGRIGLPSPALSAIGSPAMPADDKSSHWRLPAQTYAGRVKTSVNMNNNSINHWDGSTGRENSNLWEKENTKSKKTRGGHGGKKTQGASDWETTSAEPSPWLAASVAPEAWL